MKPIAIISLLILQQFFCIAQHKSISNPNDTSFLKSVKYTRLNDLVTYHIVKTGEKSVKSDIEFTVAPVATYFYLGHRYKQSPAGEGIKAQPAELTELLSSAQFSDRVGLDGVFKVSSRDMFKYKPSILKKISVRPQVSDRKTMDELVDRLKKENFVDQLLLDTVNVLPAMHKLQNVYVTVILKQGYREEKKIRGICNKLLKWSDVNQVVTSMDLFSGANESETIYRVTSEKQK